VREADVQAPARETKFAPTQVKDQQKGKDDREQQPKTKKGTG
jgi:hypothetical protein